MESLVQGLSVRPVVRVPVHPVRYSVRSVTCDLVCLVVRSGLVLRAVRTCYPAVALQANESCESCESSVRSVCFPNYVCCVCCVNCLCCVCSVWYVCYVCCVHPVCYVRHS